jgi:hypothetical protein
LPRSRVTLLSWIVAIAFILATVLLFIDRLNLVATPPELPDGTQVDRVHGGAAYRQAIWPVFLWTSLLFGLGFAASVAFAFSVAAGRAGLATFLGLTATGGIIAAIASIIPIGAVNAGVWLQYCDCGFKETEIVSQVWAQMVALDISAWLNRLASIVLAAGLVALARDAGSLLSSNVLTLTYILALALVLVPFLGITELTEPTIEELVSALTGLVLVPLWAVSLGRSVEAAEGRAA